jgi:hypothetical protein
MNGFGAGHCLSDQVPTSTNEDWEMGNVTHHPSLIAPAFLWGQRLFFRFGGLFKAITMAASVACGARLEG